MNAQIAKYIEDFKSQIVELNAELDNNSNGWVVKVGPLWIKFAGANYTKPGATGAGNASVLRTHAEAYRIAKWVQNSGGQRGQVQSRRVALMEQINSLSSSIEFLEQNSTDELPA